MWWKTLKSDRPDLFSHTHAHTRTGWGKGVVLLMSFTLYTGLQETHQWGDDVSVVKFTFNNLALALCLCSSTPACLSPCFSSSWYPPVEASQWDTPTMAHSSPPYGTGPQVPLPTSSSSSSSSSSHAFFPHPSCRGERWAAPPGHHCPTLWSEYIAEGEFSNKNFTLIVNKSFTNVWWISYKVFMRTTFGLRGCEKSYQAIMLL